MGRLRLALMAAAVGVACGGGSDAPTTPLNTGGTCTSNCTGGTTPSTPGATTNAIDVKDNSFEPAATTVNVGTTVTWTWRGFQIHNVTFSQSSLGASADQAAGTHQVPFPTAGTFSYSCTIHAGMSGSITVK